MLQPTTGTISPDSPRAADWRAVLGTTTIPLRSPVTQRATFPGMDAEHEYYELDLRMLNIAQIDRLVAHLAKRFDVPPDEVRDGIFNDGHGVPVLAEDVSVAFDARLAL